MLHNDHVLISSLPDSINGATIKKFTLRYNYEESILMDAWIKVKDSNTNITDEILYIESNDRS